MTHFAYILAQVSLIDWKYPKLRKASAKSIEAETQEICKADTKGVEIQKCRFIWSLVTTQILKRDNVEDLL